MAANMIPVNVGGYCGNRLVGQRHDLLIDITDAKPGINQQTMFRAIQEITMRFLPVAVFTDDIRFLVNLICEPVVP